MCRVCYCLARVLSRGCNAADRKTFHPLSGAFMTIEKDRFSIWRSGWMPSLITSGTSDLLNNRLWPLLGRLYKNRKNKINTWEKSERKRKKKRKLEYSRRLGSTFPVFSCVLDNHWVLAYCLLIFHHRTAHTQHCLIRDNSKSNIHLPPYSFS